MGYAAGLIGLAAPMALVAGIVSYTGRAERRRRRAPQEVKGGPPIASRPLAKSGNFDAWQAQLANQAAAEQPSQDGR